MKSNGVLVQLFAFVLVCIMSYCAAKSNINYDDTLTVGSFYPFTSESEGKSVLSGIERQPGLPERRFLKIKDIKNEHEYKMLMSLKPLLVKPPNVHFWRPQKVGSSTIVSLLVSFAYRYNLLPRRKTAQNFVCRKIAKCAWEYLDLSKDTIGRVEENAGVDIAHNINATDFRTLLQEYVSLGKWPRLDAHGRPSKKIKNGNPTARSLALDRESEIIYPAFFSVQHELCHLDAAMIRDHMECAFSKITLKEWNVSLPNGSRRHVKGSKGTEIVHTSDPQNPLHLEQAQGLWMFSEPVLPINEDVTQRSIHLYNQRNNSISSEDLVLKNPNAQGGLKEVFMVREPVARAISVYYFWGELFKMRKLAKMYESAASREKLARETNDSSVLDFHVATLGRYSKVKEVTGSFHYHGEEITAPSPEIANAYALNLPYIAGMPGPSFTWSAFAQSPGHAASIITDSDRILTIVTERMDESLVVMAYYMGWSLADLVVVKNRKDLSGHPSAKEWPESAVRIMRTQLERAGEYDVYNAAVAKLDARIAALRLGTWKQSLQGTGTAYAPLVSKVKRADGKRVNVEAEVALLQALRMRTTAICLSPEYLNKYRDFIAAGGKGLPLDASKNKLRDTNDTYAEGGHMFSYNDNILFSYDICGSCESHAMLMHYKAPAPGPDFLQQVQATVQLLPTLRNMTASERLRNVDLAKCP